MFEKILLPLDGSKLAEAAIPYIRDMAGKLNAEIMLFHVCPPGHQNLNRMHQIYLNQMADNLRQQIKETWGSSEAKISAQVVSEEQPAKGVLDYIQQNGISMVAVTTCGASGLRVWAMGSVADKVVRGSGIPTLVVRVKQKPSATVVSGLIRKILLPLDNSDASKIAIAPAVELAKKLNASVTLFSMAETIYAQNIDGMGLGVGVNWDEVDASTKQFLEDYLTGIENEIRTKGVEVNHITMIGIDAASEILELEKKLPADLVVMATRGRSPAARWVLGSTAEKVLREGELPLLLVREKTE